MNLRRGVVLVGLSVTAFAIACGPAAPSEDAKASTDSGVALTNPSPTSPTDPSPIPVVTQTQGDPDASVPVDSGAPVPQCSTLARNACTTCCNIAYPDMANAFRATLAQCVCTDPGECKDDCGDNYCKGQSASQACATCIQGSTTCGPATLKVCEAEPACAAYLSCVDACPAQ